MKTLLLVALAVAGGAGALGAQVFHNPANGHFYKLTSNVLAYHDARQSAVNMGGYLVTIDDAPERFWILNNVVPALSALQGPSGRAWIGLSDDQIEGVFEWQNGAPLNHTHWAGGEPNNGNGGDEDAVEMMVFGGQWNDVSVNAFRVSIVEIENTTLDDPSNGHFYVFTPGVADRASAKAMAAQLGGTLAVFNDAAEAAFIESNLAQKIRGLGNSGVWIGLSDEASEGTWVWDDGSPLGFSDWAPNEPSNGGIGEDGVEIRSYGTDLYIYWNDVPVNALRVGLVEVAVKLRVSAYNGPGSVRLETYSRFGDMQGITVITPNTAPGSGWFFGITPSWFEVMNQLGSGQPPFVYTTGSNAKFVFDIPSGIPAGISIAAVSVILDDPVSSSGFAPSAPVLFTTL